MREWKYDTRVMNAGDPEGDGRPELAIGHYESQVAARCAGRVYVVSLDL